MTGLDTTFALQHELGQALARIDYVDGVLYKMQAQYADNVEKKEVLDELVNHIKLIFTDCASEELH